MSRLEDARKAIQAAIIEYSAAQTEQMHDEDPESPAETLASLGSAICLWEIHSMDPDNGEAVSELAFLMLGEPVSIAASIGLCHATLDTLLNMSFGSTG